MREWIILGCIASGFAVVIWWIVVRWTREPESTVKMLTYGKAGGKTVLLEDDADYREALRNRAIDIAGQDNPYASVMSDRFHHRLPVGVWHSWPVEGCLCNRGGRIDMKVEPPRPIAGEPVLNYHVQADAAERIIGEMSDEDRMFR